MSDTDKNKSLIIKALSLAVIVLLAVLAEPYLVTRSSTVQMTDMPAGMVMKTFELGAATGTMMGMANPAASIPTVSFSIVKDTLDGWDLHVVTTNYTWTPELINSTPIAGEGHAHLYIDGNLIVLLGPWYHIDSSILPPGKHIITVSLNANDHSVFAYQGKNIQSTQTFFVNPI